MPDALTIDIFAMLAQQELELIRCRTKAALQAMRAQGAKLGKPENLTDQAREVANRALRDKAAANENNHRTAALVQAYRKQGLTWLVIAVKLNKAGFGASRGRAFQAVQVRSTNG
jgi:DNA invertase Pin-like site-specific DNA recombinase